MSSTGWAATVEGRGVQRQPEPSETHAAGSLPVSFINGAKARLSLDGVDNVFSNVLSKSWSARLGWSGTDTQ